MPLGDLTETIISGIASDFFTVTPYCLTDCGICGIACDTRFCVSTLSMSRSDPTSNDTFSRIVPSLALVDFR